MELQLPRAMLFERQTKQLMTGSYYSQRVVLSIIIFTICIVNIVIYKL